MFSVLPALRTDAGESDFHVPDCTGYRVCERSDIVFQSEIGDGAALFADEVSVRGGIGIIACAVDMIEPPDEVVSGEFVKDPVDTFTGDGGKFFTHVFPDGINIRMAAVASHTFVYGEPLRGAFPLEIPADPGEIFLLTAVHF